MIMLIKQYIMMLKHIQDKRKEAQQKTHTRAVRTNKQAVILAERTVWKQDWQVFPYYYYLQSIFVVLLHDRYDQCIVYLHTFI